MSQKKGGTKGFQAFLDGVLSSPDKSKSSKQAPPKAEAATFSMAEIKKFPQKPQTDKDLMQLLTQSTSVQGKAQASAQIQPNQS